MGPTDKVPIVNGLLLNRFLTIGFRAERAHVSSSPLGPRRGHCCSDESAIRIEQNHVFYAIQQKIGLSNTYNAPMASKALQVRLCPRTNALQRALRFASPPWSDSPRFRELYPQKGSDPRVDSKPCQHSVNSRRRGTRVLVFTWT
jgi:hypothetical protein